MAKKFVVAHGLCDEPNCPKPKQKAVGYDEEDAMHMLRHAHGIDCKHCFHGFITYLTVTDEE